MTRINPELKELASACGVMTEYVDVFQQRRTVSADSLLALLGSLGIDVRSMNDVPGVLEAQRVAQLQRGIEPVVVIWDGDPVEVELTLASGEATGQAVCTIQLEGERDPVTERLDLCGKEGRTSSCGRFVTRRVRLPRVHKWGYHRLRIERAGRAYEALLIAAPRRAYAADKSTTGQWGCFLPLYALRSERNWGAGDFSDLRHLVDWTTDCGGTIVGTLPMLAAFLDEPCEPSPYAPASRLAWNEFYIDVTSIPGVSRCAEAAELMSAAAFRRAVTQLRDLDQVDYRRIMALKRQVLELLSRTFFQQKPQGEYAAFERFLQQHPHAEDYAEFRAAQERCREPWNRWPLPLREGRLSGDDYDPRSKQYHLYAQWIATSQLESLADRAGGGLYLDLPLGVRPDGYDVFRWRDVYACGASAGSPPDAMWTKGQDWCFPPLHPQRIREQGYRHVRDYLRHHLRLARLLRIDHVMQLHRLYWIPGGMRVDQGAYVRYRAEEFYAILNLESHRCRTTLIGENLGTVPPEVNQAMDQRGLRRMYVMQYEIAASDDDDSDPALSAGAPGREQEGDPASGGPRRKTPCNPVPAGSLASLNTHDMPTFAAWWLGTDIDFRRQIDLLSPEEADREEGKLEVLKSELTTWLRAEGWLGTAEPGDTEVLHALLEFLAASDAGAVLVNLEDLWLETRPQNVPGTGPELPNWKRKATVTLEEFTNNRDVSAVLARVARARRQAAASATTRVQQPG